MAVCRKIGVSIDEGRTTQTSMCGSSRSSAWSARENPRNPHFDVAYALTVGPGKPATMEDEVATRSTLLLGRVLLAHLDRNSDARSAILLASQSRRVLAGRGLPVRGRPYDWRIARFILIERGMSRFLREPVSIRGAVGTIVMATAVVVVASGALMTLVDHREFPNAFRGMWWALQTVTTVGYGDVTPRRVSGRAVAAVVMFEGIALLAIVTAAITSSFVERAQRADAVSGAAEELREQEHVDARFDDLSARLERVESLLRGLTKS